MNMREVDEWIKQTQEEAIEGVRRDWHKDCAHYAKGDLPAAPLVEYFLQRAEAYEASHTTYESDHIHGTGLQTFCHVNGLNENHLYRVRKKGWITVGLADFICCRLGIHPIQIYGNLWTDDMRLFA